MPKTFLICIIFCFCTSVRSQVDRNLHWDPGVCDLMIYNDTIHFKYGLLGEEGNWRLAPEFNWIDIKYDRVLAKKDSLYALFDLKGKTIVPFRKEPMDLYAYYNSDDPIYTKENGNRIILDNMGIPIVSREYSDPVEWSYDYFRFTYQGKPGFMSRDRKVIFWDEADYITIANEHLFVVYRGSHSYLYNMNGAVLDTFDFIGDPSSMSVVHYPYGTFEVNGLFGLCDIRTGRICIPPLYRHLNYTDDTTAVLSDKNEKCGLMSYDGKIIIDTIYDEYKIDFENNLAMKKDSLWAIFNYQGKQLSKFEYTDLSMDGYGSRRYLTLVKKNNRYQFLDSLARPISAEYDDVSPRWRGLQFSVVKNGGNFGLVNLVGKENIPCKYDELFLSDIHLLIAKKNGQYGVIDTSGKIIVPFEYDDIEFDYYGKGYYVYMRDIMLLLKKNDLYGLANTEGKIIFPVKHKYITYHYGMVIAYNYKPCFNCEGLLRVDEPREAERVALCSVTGKYLTDYKYDNIWYVFSNGAIIFKIGDEYG